MMAVNIAQLKINNGCIGYYNIYAWMKLVDYWVKRIIWMLKWTLEYQTHITHIGWIIFIIRIFWCISEGF